MNPAAPLDPSAVEAEVARLLDRLANDLMAVARLRDMPEIVPPIALEKRLNGGHNQAVARYIADLVVSPPLPADAVVLDVGCGYGRVAVELTQLLHPEQRYLGVDPDRESVHWAASAIAPRFPNFRFTHIDVASKVYNPTGELRGPTWRFPADDASIDAVLMVSVMTHVDVDTVRTYLRESARVLAPGGRLIVTFFLLDEEVDELLAQGQSMFTMPARIGPSRAQLAHNPEAAIAHPRALVAEVLADAGFDPVSITNGFWSGRARTTWNEFQDVIVAVRAGSGVNDHAVTPGPHAVTERILRAARDLVGEGVSGPDDLRTLIAWSYPIVINVMWWQEAGATVTWRDRDGGVTVVGGFPASRRLVGGARDSIAEARTGQVIPIADEDLYRMLATSRTGVTRDGIVDAIVEMVHRGIDWRSRLARGEILDVRTADGEAIQPALPPAP